MILPMFCAMLATGAHAAAQTFTFSHFAGSTGGAAFRDGVGGDARFDNPRGVAVDSAGNVYVSDSQNHVIRKITAGGTVATLAGMPGTPGTADGVGATARFRSPRGLALDQLGALYVADTGNHTIRKVTPDGAVTTLAGLGGSSGSADGVGSAARFAAPAGVTVGVDGMVYVADTGNHTIRMITQAGAVTVLAGGVQASGTADGTGSGARFNRPAGLSIDESGALYVADSSNHAIRKVSPAAEVTTVAGLKGSFGAADGTGTTARFNRPESLVLGGSGTLFVTDTLNHVIRRVTMAGVVTTLAGSLGAPYLGSNDGTGPAAQFFRPIGIAWVGTTLYVADTENHTVRQVTLSGAVTTLAGMAAKSGHVNDTGAAARFTRPFGVSVAGDGTVYVADTENRVVRRTSTEAVVSAFAGSAGQYGDQDGLGAAARFASPRDVAVGPSGIVYVADAEKHTIRKIGPDGAVTTLAGSAGVPGSSDGQGPSARFRWPEAVAVAVDGAIYVADRDNHTIRKVTPTGQVSTVAGLAGASGTTDGTGAAARFNSPQGVTVAADGNLFVADYYNHTVRQVTPGGVVTTLAGSAGTPGSTDGAGSAARFRYPSRVAVDGAGVLFVTGGDQLLRRVLPTGVVTTIGGRTNVTGAADGVGTAAVFNGPQGLAVDDAGNLIVADTDNHAIRRGVPDAVHLRVAKAGTGSGTVSSSPGGLDCGPSCIAAFAPGTPVTLAASPAPGSVFSGWAAAGCQGGGPCAVTMAGPMTVTAIFDLQASAPTLTAISPAQGGVGGGTPVRLTGTGFVPGATVTIGGAAATSVVVIGATSIAALSPPGTLGAAAVSVTTPGGTATLPAAFTYVPAPTFTDAAVVQGVTPVRAVHLTELRQRVDDLRARYGLPGAAWSDISLAAGQTPVKAVHVSELRTALNAVLTAAGLPAPTYPSPAPVAGLTPILATHVTELRSAIAAIW